jgi:hypothetical protein
VDWNLDGRPDLIAGDRNGNFNLWISTDSGFEAHLQVPRMDSTPLNVGYNAYPYLIDWNGDGKRDLFLGCENGQVLLWPNMANDSWPMFQEAETVQAAGAPIYVYRVNPFVFDFDLDGVNDLVTGAGDGFVYFFRNLGTNAEPDLAAAETVMTVAGAPVRTAGTNYGSRCWFGFWDGDTVPDILLSAYDGNVELFRGQFMTGVAEQRPALPAGRLTLAASPNPCAGRTVIACEVPGSAALDVYDDAGRVVRHLGMVSGRGTRGWDGRDDAGAEVRSGVYFCRLNGRGQAASERVVLSR